MLTYTRNQILYKRNIKVTLNQELNETFRFHNRNIVQLELCKLSDLMFKILIAKIFTFQDKPANYSKYVLELFIMEEYAPVTSLLGCN
jgi:hypothetical protein